MIFHHGAIDGVTGSCHELRVDARNTILVDCGLFQGGEVSPHGAGAERLEIDFDISRVRALLVTHCHLRIANLGLRISKFQIPNPKF